MLEDEVPSLGPSGGVTLRVAESRSDEFIEQGARMILVDTDAENHQAIAFFRGQGFGNETAHVYLEQNLTSHPTYVRKRAKGRTNAARAHPKPKTTPVEPGEH